jgi:antitoxin component of MazEF toxin-antitoxin module
MKRKLVQTGSSLAVTLPADVVQDFKLEKGQVVDVSLHPTSGTLMVRLGVKYIDDGKVTKRFRKRIEEVGRRYEKAFEELAK